MAKFSQLSIVVSTGAGSTATVVINIPQASASDPFATDQASGTDNAQQAPGVAGLVQTIARLGFWDAQGLNFYPPSSIVKISPQ